jgi:hypothetical protein
MVIRDEQDIYNILTNREKLEYFREEYEKKNNHLDNEEDVQQICCNEITTCVREKNENTGTGTIIPTTSLTYSFPSNTNNKNNFDSHRGENIRNKDESTTAMY